MARREEIDAHARPTGRVQVCRNLKKYDRARAKDLARRYRNEL